MSVLLYHMMCVIITAFVSVLFFVLTQNIRFWLSDRIKRWISYACLIIFFTCSIFVIDCLNDLSNTVVMSWLSILFALTGVLLCGLVVMLVQRIQRKWKRMIPIQLLMCIQCFLLLYLILWYLLPFLFSFWITIPTEAVRNHDLVLLIVMCEAGILTGLLAAMDHHTNNELTHRGLTKEEYHIYQSFQRNCRRYKNKY